MLRGGCGESQDAVPQTGKQLLSVRARIFPEQRRKTLHPEFLILTIECFEDSIGE